MELAPRKGLEGIDDRLHRRVGQVFALVGGHGDTVRAEARYEETNGSQPRGDFESRAGRWHRLQMVSPGLLPVNEQHARWT
jgi:hypothetical protein